MKSAIRRLVAVALLVPTVLFAFPPSRRLLLYPMIWHELEKISFSPIEHSEQLRPRGTAMTVEVEEGQDGHTEAVKHVVSDSVAIVEAAWGPFDHPVKIRLSNGFTFFDHYQASIFRLPKAFAWFDTLYLFSDPGTSTPVNAVPPSTEGGLPLQIPEGGGGDGPIDAPSPTDATDASADDSTDDLPDEPKELVVYRQTITHELTHLRMYQLMSPDGVPWMSPDVPRWFVEGMGGYTSGEPHRKARQVVVDFHRRFPNVDLASGGQVYFNRNGNVAYDVSYFLFRAIVYEHGRDGLQTLFRKIRGGLTFDDAFRKTFAESRENFERRQIHALFEDPLPILCKKLTFLQEQRSGMTCEDPNVQYVDRSIPGQAFLIDCATAQAYLDEDIEETLDEITDDHPIDDDRPELSVEEITDRSKPWSPRVPLAINDLPPCADVEAILDH